MKLDEYKQMVEAQRLASLGKGLEALMKSKAIQEKMKEENKWVPMYQLNQYVVRLALA